jgi:hypothetical protein
MTLCGGVCEFRPGGGCRIKLSEPLLKVGSGGRGGGMGGCGNIQFSGSSALSIECPDVCSAVKSAAFDSGPAAVPPACLPLQLRPSRDLKMVLLHEMIHADMMLQGGQAHQPSSPAVLLTGTAAAALLLCLVLQGGCPPPQHCCRSLLTGSAAAALSAGHRCGTAAYPHWQPLCGHRIACCLNPRPPGLWPSGIRDDDPGGHGTRFKAAMGAINASTAPDHQRPAAGCAAAASASSLRSAVLCRS